MRRLYFAYGSNLKWDRLRRRVPRAEPAGIGWLAGHAVAFDKRGRDGSGKANLSPAPDARVWGALYRLHLEDFARLDRFEGGYERVEVRVARPGGGLVEAITYRSGRLLDAPVAFDWYRRLVLEGAREHGLPEEHVGRLESLPWRADPGGTDVDRD